jgi:hypothetical protein
MSEEDGDTRGDMGGGDAGGDDDLAASSVPADCQLRSARGSSQGRGIPDRNGERHVLAELAQCRSACAEDPVVLRVAASHARDLRCLERREAAPAEPLADLGKAVEGTGESGQRPSSALSHAERLLRILRQGVEPEAPVQVEVDHDAEQAHLVPGHGLLDA